MASTRIPPFPIHGLVPYRGALYAITHQEVFSQGRLYRIGRYVGDRYDERVLVDHWDLLANIEQQARCAVGEVVRHRELGLVTVVKRAWRFSSGVVVYTVRAEGDERGARHAHAHDLRPHVPGR